MSVAVFISNKSDAQRLIPWGVHYACSGKEDLLIVCPKKSTGKRGWEALEVSEKDDSTLYQSVFEIISQQDPEIAVLKQKVTDGDEPDDERVSIETQELLAPNPVEAFVEEVAGLKISLLLLPANEYNKGSKDDQELWVQKLFLHAPCQVAIVHGIPTTIPVPKSILVASHDQISEDDELSVSIACKLARGAEGGEVTLLYVRPDDDDVALQVAEKRLAKLARGVNAKDITVHQRVELADSFQEGINRLDLERFDLVMVGTRNPKTMRSLFRDVGQGEDGPRISVSTIRQSVPMSDRLWTKFRQWVRGKVPQIDREYRVALVDRLELSSRFDFDFIALISLSTLIAALGLARNSGAVVIGAMLVAPLMTPLVAIGFALVQGNSKLINNAFRSVVLGFTVALAIGVALGTILHLLAPSFQITEEMRGRDMPNLLDLVVALASGVAGAYAMGRPNLISALPGVAIAAALVPPIATCGLALAMGDFGLSGGASLLFLTNIVAIVLGTAVTFWSVGISTRKVKSENRAEQMWPRYWFLGFVLVSFVLAGMMTWINPLEQKTNPEENLIQVETQEAKNK